ncbi:hypothetical protein NMY22_g11631 [Coprinellus aureogranulatus]|nr:hypothetical protein NMY22_g11631 [Coprinellus aureogranulatus]
MLRRFDNFRNEKMLDDCAHFVAYTPPTLNGATNEARAHHIARPIVVRRTITHSHILDIHTRRHLPSMSIAAIRRKQLVASTTSSNGCTPNDASNHSYSSRFLPVSAGPQTEKGGIGDGGEDGVSKSKRS